ncbi:hypothetical protein HDE_06978 [Halotydeus destructor]|nr:hypothetical protein HDE_06978 [Halotydeus destructor]
MKTSLVERAIYALGGLFFVFFVTELSIRYFKYDQLTDYMDSSDLGLRPAISICFEFNSAFPVKPKTHSETLEIFRNDGQEAFGNISQSVYMRNNETICFRLAHNIIPASVKIAYPLPVPHEIGLHDGNYLQNGDVTKSVIYSLTFLIYDVFHTVRLPRNCFPYQYSRAECWQMCNTKHNGYRHVNFPSSEEINDYGIKLGYNRTTERICSAQCAKLDCASTGYIPANIKAERQRRRGHDSDYLQFSFLLQTSIVYKLQMSLDVYALTIISVFGLSFDISVLAVTTLIATSLVSTMSKVIKYSATAFMPLAFVLQIVQISMKYYSYEVSTDVYIGSPRYLTYPILWICHPRYQGFVDFEGENALATFNYEASNADNVSHIGQHQKLFIRDSIQRILRCFRIEIPKERYLTTDQILISIYVKYDIATNADYALSPHKKPYVNIRSPLRYPRIITYDISNVSRLAAPYPSRCISYDKDECSLRCLLETQSKQNCSSYSFPQVLERYQDCDYRFTAKTNANCRDKCSERNECLTLQYKEKIADMAEQRFVTDLSPLNTTFFDIMPPNTEITITEVPSLTLTSFLIYISGLFGLWYGANFSTLKQLAVNKLKDKNIEVAISIILAVVTFCHSAIEMVAYFEYATATLTTFETQDSIPKPTLCIVHYTTPSEVVNLTAIDLNRLHAGHILDQIITLDGDRQYVNHDAKNMSSFKWIEMIDIYKKMSCLNPTEKTRISRELSLTYPARRLFMLRYNSSKRTLPAFYITSPFLGGGFEDAPIYVPLDRNRPYVYDTVHLKLLTAPFSSMCHPYPKSDESCLNQCLRETSYRLDKRLYNTAQTYCNDTRLFALHRTKNTDLVENICSNLCKRPQCDNIGYRINMNRFMGSPKGNGYVEVIIDEYVMSSTFYPVLTLYDHTVILFGLLGLWLGFSVLGMRSLKEPFGKVLKMFRRKPLHVKRRVAWLRSNGSFSDRKYLNVSQRKIRVQDGRTNEDSTPQFKAPFVRAVKGVSVHRQSK